jgi:hypothetical protein
MEETQTTDKLREPIDYRHERPWSWMRPGKPSFHCWGATLEFAELEQMQQDIYKEKYGSSIKNQDQDETTEVDWKFVNQLHDIFQKHETIFQKKDTKACFVCGKKENLKICYTCKKVAYCSKKCQWEFWEEHRKTHKRKNII